MQEFLENLPARARQKRKENKLFFSKLRRRPPKQLDELAREVHDAEFESTDCLECANCCKTTGPLFTPRDISRIAGHFRMRPREFTAKFLRTDEDGDEVLQELPCPFLMSDNACSIYEVRPKACREYPHTDRKKLYQIGSLTVRNTEVCPAAFRIVENLKARLPDYF